MPAPPQITIDDAAWQRVLARAPGPAGYPPLYAPFLADGDFVLGRIAQTLDGRIATASGMSFWISGPEDILHTHRLRALCDAIIVGAGTVTADDPLLTTRLCAGPSPVRVVIDTDRRLVDTFRMFQSGPPTLLLAADDIAGGDRLGTAEVLRLPRASAGGLSVPAVLAALAGRGLRRIFVEGGGITVSRFLAAGALDRLHVTVAPLLLGSGIPAFTLPGVARPEDGLRLDWQVHHLGEDLLFDIPLA
ncbi:MAG: RibD family protein, partial [Acetobacteraceae bacterium]|nr:RibD family protein [Acetobacteraceae bacterium]